MKHTISTSSKGKCLLAAALLAMLGVIALGSSSASAALTHKYLYSFNVPVSPDTALGTEINVAATDAEGNVYIVGTTAENRVRIRRYTSTGTPVEFEALNSMVLDGEGGADCPATPSDCDRAPPGRMFAFAQGTGGVAIDASNGPAHGNIYVVSRGPGEGEIQNGVYVFDHDGRYLGHVPLHKAFPRSSPRGHVSGVSVDVDGQVYVYCFASAPCQWDRFAPVNGDPADLDFLGQIGYTHGTVGAAGSTFTYSTATALNHGNSGFKRYKNNVAYFLTTYASLTPADSILPFVNGEPSEAFTENIVVDPGNEHVFFASPSIEEWTEGGEQKVGPAFGPPHTNGQGSLQSSSLAIDRSGGATDGYIFTRGSANLGKSVAVFSGQVPIPDLTYNDEVAGHDTVKVSANIDLAGGPEVIQCRFEFDLGTVPCEQSMPIGDGAVATASLTGLKLDTTYTYRVVVETENGRSPGESRKTQAEAVLSLSTDSATGIDRNHAILNGSLDPDGIETEYHFEYGTSKDYNSQTEPELVDGNGKVSLPGEPLEKLQSGRTYHYALVATNELGTTVGKDRTFTTARPPTIAGLHASNLGASSATVNARVNPFGYETTYRFEYGTTPEYGSVVPAVDAAVGAGSDPVPVSFDLSGLRPGVTYHFRVFATNEWGATASEDTTFDFLPPSCPNAHVRQQTDASYLPDCRAYELLTPPEQGSVQLFPSDILVDVGFYFGLDDSPQNYFFAENTGDARNPSRFAFFGSVGSITGLSTPNSYLDMYVTSRSEFGWTTSYPGLSPAVTQFHARTQCSAHLHICLDHKSNTNNDGYGYRYENAPHAFSVSGEHLGQWPTNVASVPDGVHYVGDNRPSGDFSHYAFSSRDHAFAPGAVIGGPGSAYDNDIAAKTVTIASRTASGAHIPSDSKNSNEFIGIPAVSHDGSHILLSTASTEGPANLYMRIDQSITYEIAHGVKFIGMAEDGSRVILTATSRLTGEDTDESIDLYAWEEATGSLELLSVGGEEGNADNCFATWTSLCGVQIVGSERADLDSPVGSATGATYFFSPESLDPNRFGVRNQRNLYVVREGAPEFVATLDAGTNISRITVSPDGVHAAFISAARLTDYDNEGFEMMYAFDAETGGTSCSSCNPTGDPPSADVAGAQSGPFMSDDGRSFFATEDALVPQDTNGLIDVYEYVGGRPQLITTGVGSLDEFPGDFARGILYPRHDLGLEAVSADGVDVYFSTYETLVPQDHNGQFIKFYDARTGGGFLTRPGLAPCAAADECHGKGSEAPAMPQVGTGASLGVATRTMGARQLKRQAAKRRTARKRALAKRAKRRASAKSNRGAER